MTNGIQKYEKGDARAVEVGVIQLKDGRIIKGALFDFPAGPPDLPFRVVWDGTPLIISIKPLKPTGDALFDKALEKEAA